MSEAGAVWCNAFATATTDGMARYERVFVRGLFTPWARVLVDAVGARSGMDAVDVATGPGSVARVLAERVGSAGRVTGTDISAAMLAIARAKPPIEGGAAIEYVECPACPLALPDAAFDVATCQQGLQFFPDRPGALAELRRVLRTGGVAGVAVWTPIKDSPIFAAIRDSLGDLSSDLAVRYEAGPWGLTDGAAIAALLEGAGFAGVDATVHEVPMVFASVSDAVDILLASPVADDVRGWGDDPLDGFTTAFATRVRPFVRDGAIEAPSVSNIVVGVNR